MYLPMIFFTYHPEVYNYAELAQVTRGLPRELWFHCICTGHILYAYSVYLVILYSCYSFIYIFTLITELYRACLFSIVFRLMCVTILDLQLSDTCVLHRCISFCSVYIDREYI